VSGYTDAAPIPGVTPTSNVFNGANNRVNGQGYDAAGNVTQLSAIALAYDAENRQTTATQAGVGSQSYKYDAEGRRILHTDQNGIQTVYVYDAPGQMVAEYSR
jgi:YD repeat-containing protein